MKNLASTKSTNVRLPFSPDLMNSALRLAPWLQKPLLTRLFLTPARPRKAQKYQAPVVGSVQVAGRVVRVRARGRGPTVMMVHGWQGHAGHFTELGDRLVSGGFTVVTFDMPAHGETKGHTTNLAEFVETIFRVADFVGPLQAIIAHSLGATAAALALDRGLEVEGAALVAPMISFDFALDEFSKILHLDGELREATARGTEEKAGLQRHEANLKALDAPAEKLLIVHDTDDVRTPYRYSEELAKLWPQAQFETTRGYGHKEVLKSPELGRAISEFLGGLPLCEDEPLHLGLIPEMRF